MLSDTGMAGTARALFHTYLKLLALKSVQLSNEARLARRWNCDVGSTAPRSTLPHLLGTYTSGVAASPSYRLQQTRTYLSCGRIGKGGTVVVELCYSSFLLCILMGA